MGRSISALHKRGRSHACNNSSSHLARSGPPGGAERGLPLAAAAWFRWRSFTCRRRLEWESQPIRAALQGPAACRLCLAGGRFEARLAGSRRPPGKFALTILVIRAVRRLAAICSRCVVRCHSETNELDCPLTLSLLPHKAGHRIQATYCGLQVIYLLLLIVPLGSGPRAYRLLVPQPLRLGAAGHRQAREPILISGDRKSVV